MNKTRNHNWVKSGGKENWLPKGRVEPKRNGTVRHNRPTGPRPERPADDDPIEKWIAFVTVCKRHRRCIGKLSQPIKRQLMSKGVI